MQNQMIVLKFKDESQLLKDFSLSNLDLSINKWMMTKYLGKKQQNILWDLFKKEIDDC